MPRRIVVHAGFHKTGTSTVQTLLRDNREALKPYLRSMLKGGMTELLSAARGFSTWRDPVTLAKFDHRLRAMLTRHSNMPRRCLCLSAEELSGHLPGRGDLASYSAAPVLAATMARAIQDMFPGSELVFYYSTRAPDDWLRSAYWEHVKSSSLTMDWDEFADRYRDAADLDAIVDAVASAQPAPVQRARLEQITGRPGGPAAPVLNLCDVPPRVLAQLTPPAPVNTRLDSSVLLALLAANRDYPDRAARLAAKQAILDTAKETPGD